VNDEKSRKHAEKQPVFGALAGADLAPMGSEKNSLDMKYLCHRKMGTLHGHSALRFVRRFG
jgi:hypothetical protein